MGGSGAMQWQPGYHKGPAGMAGHAADGQLSIFLWCLEQIPVCYTLEQSQSALEARGSKDVFTGKTEESSRQVLL